MNKYKIYKICIVNRVSKETEKIEKTYLELVAYESFRWHFCYHNDLANHFVECI